MDSPLITVIVPIYKVELYLRKCIDSILVQSYTNLEIILVDDGSPDLCPQICEEYAERDLRIRIIHKNNGGLSDARNAALDICTGDYITCIDSDDYVDSDYVEFLYSLIVKSSADIACCSYRKFKFSNPPKDINKEKRPPFILTKEEALALTLYQQWDNAAWGKLYQKGLFNQIRYPKNVINEDLAVLYKIFDISDRIVFSDIPKYNYLIRNNSILREPFHRKKVSVIDLSEEILDFVINRYPNAKKAAINRLVSASFQIFLQIPRDNIEFCDCRDRAWKNIRKYRHITLFDKNIRIKNKAAIILSYLGALPLSVVWKKVNHFRHWRLNLRGPLLRTVRCSVSPR